MTDDEYTHKLDELERLLNDPDVAMQPARVWSLLADLSQAPCGGSAMAPSRPTAPALATGMGRAAGVAPAPAN